MPRTNDFNELFRKLDSLKVFRLVTSSPGSTTLAASLASGATAANLTSTTNFTSGDPVFIIGDGGCELNGITATTPTTAVPLLYKANFAQSSGASFVEAVSTDLGHIEEGGLVLNASQPLSPINSAFQALPLTYIYGYGEFEATFGLLGFNGLNFQTALGIPESEQGTGTPSDPYQVGLSGAAMGTQTIQCFRATGTRHDGKTIIFDLNNAKISMNGAVNLNRTAPAVVPCSIKFTTAVLRIST